MKCSDIKEYLEDYIEDNLEDEKKREIKEHMSSCKDCKKEYENLKSSINVLSGLKTIDPPEDMWKKVAVKISGKEKKPVIFFRPLLVPVMVSVIIIFFMGTLLKDIRKENMLNAGLKEVYCLLSQKNYSLAMEKTDELIESNLFEKALPELMLIKGKCYYGLEEKEKALNTYRETGEKFPDHPAAGESYYLTGLYYEEEDNLTEASLNYSRALEKYNIEEIPEDLLLRAKTIETILAGQEALLAVRGGGEEKTHQKNLEKVNKIIEEKISPEKINFKIKEAEMLIEKKEFQEGLNILEDLPGEDISDNNLTFQASFLRGKSLYGLGKYKKAEEIFEKIIKDSPREYTKKACYYLGEINLKAGKIKEASEYFQKAGSSPPEKI